ncbi:alpha/beta hydrolase [Pokkaliibacter plantistimulans]|uniref:Alpha/beta hydrolase n=1 Tax=Proteobacteria bacterium 228 TaxID=2083153 RepID=A0A2S5KHA0_9PROT|nr:alpha/beta fold hydrolase [Pokkaliibacter plantistimulans]PPC73963.1 alpha/beta hydrolase [Pokkaliibacter plantistimulans]
MSKFLLIHGAWQGQWVWEAVATGLRMHGHQVETMDLPGSGNSTLPLASVTLDSYAEGITERLSAMGGDVMLVGHSMGGMAISAAAERAPTLLQRLIYLCAFLPEQGDSIASLNALLDDHDTPDMVLVEQSRASQLTPDAIASTFMHDCDAALIDWASPQFRPQALSPITTPVSLSATHFGVVPRDYICCLQDQAIDIQLQRKMLERSPCQRIVKLNSSHSPFFSQPWELTQCLHRLAATP